MQATPADSILSVARQLEHVVRDPIWQFVGVIVAVVAIAVTLWMALKRTHGLSYEYRVDSLASVSQAVTDKIQILFNDSPVHDVSLVRVRVMNTGRQPIRSADFEQPLSIAFGSNSRVLRGEVESTRPPGLNVDFYPAPDSGSHAGAIVIQPLLLNSRDAFTLKLILTGKPIVPVLHGRVVNISEFGSLATTRESLQARLLRTGLWGMSLIGGIFFFIWLPSSVVFVGFIAYCALTFILTAILSYKFDRRFVDRDRL